jgi:CRP/FNR family transcriptional regulator
VRKISCEQCGAESCCIVRDLPADGLEKFRACGVTGLYRRRQVIFHEDAPAEGLYLLCEGTVKLFRSDRFGRDHILAIAGPGDVLSELSLDPAERYSVSAEALGDCQVCYLSRERLVAFMREHPMVAVRLIAALSRALAAARRKAGELALKRAEGRLADLLMRLAHAEPNGNAGARVTLAYSRRDLAEMIGVSTETAIRLLAKLKAKRVIATDQRELVVTDAARLARIANHDGP